MKTIVAPTPQAELRTPTGRKAMPPVARDIALVWMICGLFLNLLGPIAPLMVMTGAGALLMLSLDRLPLFFKGWPLLLLAIIAPLSAAWSDEPAVSLRYGLQWTITAVAMMIAVISTGHVRYVRGLFIATAIILALCILSGRQGISQGGPVLIGVLGSKNAMGQLCMLVICSSATLMLSPNQPVILRRIAIVTGVVGTLVLLRTFATGAAISTILFAGVFALLAIASRLSAGAKVLLVGVLIVATAPLVFIYQDIIHFYEWFLVEVLNKDVGLTGRNYLWHHADALIASKPVLGHGYRSIWLGHGSETIGLLRWADLESGIGFNFHNTFREVLVDFGFVGAAVVFIPLGVGFARLLLRASSEKTDTALWFLAAMAVVMIVKSYAETLLGSFGDASLIVIGTAMFGYILPRQGQSLRGW